jgi:putative ABC transport system permease protein
MQFILENVILCTFAVLIGLALAKFLFLPGFSQIINDPLGADLFTSFRTWAALIILILLSALGGAAYPAFYISAFNPVNIIKGASKISGRNRFRRRLLGFQFFLTFLTLSTAIAFMNEAPKAKSKPWGYSPADNVVVSLDKSANYESFRDELKNSSDVLSVTGAEQSLGQYSKEIVIKDGAEEKTVQAINALPGFASQLGIKIVAGRDFNDQYETDKSGSALVNQAFIKQMRWKSAVGKNIKYEGKPYLIVGETNDFRFEDFKTPVGPLVITGCTSKDVSIVYVKTSGGLFTKGHLAVGKIWKKTNPNLPFEYHYQDSVFDNYFSGFDEVGQILGTAAGIMMIVSISGIFGLALIILGRKMKEISVRKVLGAGFANIAFVIMKEFLWAIGFSVVFGFPVSWWLSGIMFKQISAETSISLIPFVFTSGILLIMTLLSVSWHIYRANTADPTEFLANE